MGGGYIVKRMLKSGKGGGCEERLLFLRRGMNTSGTAHGGAKGMIRSSAREKGVRSCFFKAGRGVVGRREG